MSVAVHASRQPRLASLVGQLRTILRSPLLASRGGILLYLSKSSKSEATGLKSHCFAEILILPIAVKIILFLLVLINAPSFPFQWHIRVWWHAIKAYWLVYRKGRAKYIDDWEATNMKRGQIKSLRTRMKRIAWVDDCDYNIHLSNSCYAKNSDPARMDYCIQSMSPLFTPGVHMALAGSHYIFLREIPMGSEYFMETRTIGWGEKWFYPVTEFIIYPKHKTRKSDSARLKAQAVLSDAKTELNKKLNEASSAATSSAIPSISGPPTETPTPDRVSGTNSPIPNLEEAKRAALRSRKPRADGGVVACLAVWEYCFKLGRQTVPPRIALYVALQSPKKEHRDHVKKLLFSKDQGRAWIRGGWKNEPNADQLGLDIGVDAESDGTWIERGKKAMEVMTDGLASIEQ